MDEHNPITYIAFLNGIQSSGNNRISMIQLGYSFHTFSFRNEYPYEPTGDVIFESINTSTSDLSSSIERLIYAVNNIKLKAYVLSAEQLGQLLEKDIDHEISLEKEFVRSRADLEVLYDLSLSTRPHSHSY